MVTIEEGALKEISGTDMWPYAGCHYVLYTQITVIEDRITVQHNPPSKDFYGIEIVLSSELAEKCATGGVVIHFQK